MQLRHAPRDAMRYIKQRTITPISLAALRLKPIKRGMPHTLPGKLIVSLTSYPPRYPTLDLTLRSLLSQDMAPDEVVLWIAHADRASLPRRVEILENFGLTIRTCEDTRSYKNMFPALEFYSNTFILIAGDDIGYPRGWLRNFAEAYKHAGEILCQSARRVTAGDGRFVDYEEWPQLPAGASGPNVFPVGYAGKLYPPSSLGREATNIATALRLAPHGDDIWFYWMALRAGTSHRVIERAGKFKRWPGTESSSLWLTRNRDGGNDRQIAAMVDAWGHPEGVPPQPT